MDCLLTDPTAVLVLGEREPAVDALRTAVDAGSVSDVVVVAEIAPAREALATRCDVGCVVVADDPQDGTVHDACERLHAVDEKRPILLALGTPAGTMEARATSVGASEIVVDEADLPERAAAAVERYARRRNWEAQSSMFDAFVDGVEGAIYVKDEQARHLRKSATPGDFSQEEFIGKTDVDVYGESPNTRDSHEDDMRVIEDGESIHGKEASYTTPDGTHWSRSTKVPWRHDGEIVGLVGWTRDSTEEVRRRQRLERQDERMEQFIRSLRHDVRNPLQIASGIIGLARETGSVDRLDRANEAVARIDQILDDLTETVLEESMLPAEETGGGRPEPVSIPELAADVWDLVGVETATLEIEFEGDAVVNAPRSSIRPVFENLLRNAVDHGGADVTVRVGPLDSGGLYVADDGPGIPEAERGTVFEDGYTTTRTGTGTGLSIVDSIATQRHWDLQITESWAGGTRIELRNTMVVAEPTTELRPGDALELTDGVDLGDVNVAGHSTHDVEADRWRLTGSGKNIYGHWNELHYRCVTVEGPVRITGRVHDVDGANEWSTAGLMVRDSLDEDAAYGHVAATVGHGTKIDWRAADGEEGTSRHLEDTDVERPWYRIDRVGERLTISASTDGDVWDPLDQRRIALDDPVVVGLTVCSVQPDELTDATFDSVAVNRLTGPR